MRVTATVRAARGKATGPLLLAAALVLTACSGGASNGEAATTSTPRDGDAATTAANGDSDGATGQLPETVTIGGITALTGAGAFCGENERDGINLAVKHANEQGLLGETQVEARIEDTASAPESGLSAYQTLVSADVPVIVGGCLSSVAQGIMPSVDREAIPWVIGIAAAEELVAPEYAYRAGAPQSGYVTRTADVLADRGVSSIDIVFTNDNESIIDLLDAVRPKLEQVGIEVGREEGVAGTAQDFTAQVSQIVSSAPDAVASFLVGAQNVTFVTQLRESGFDGPIYGQNAMAPPFFIENAGDAANGIVMALNFHPSFPFDSSQAFAAAFEEEYGRSADLTAAAGYDAAWRGLNAISDAGSVEPDDVKDALDERNTLDGAQGPMEFSPEGDTTVPGGVVEIENGEIVGVEEGTDG